MVKTPYRFYTYAYLREDKTPYYIGKGSGYRIYYRRKNEVIKPPKDKTRIIFLKQNLTEEEAFRHEKYMIAVFGRKDIGTGILHNRTDGGEGPANIKRTRKHIESLMRGRLSYTFTDEVKNKIRNTLKEKNIKPPSRKGIKHNENFFNKRCKITYEVTSPYGEIFITNRIKTFCEENNLHCGTIRDVAKGKYKQHKGWTVKIVSQDL
jgi:hypothetical protein